MYLNIAIFCHMDQELVTRILKFAKIHEFLTFVKIPKN